jgi:type IV pilus assembly protein PilC
MPIFGEMIRKATIARWTRTLSTMFAAGVPLVEALDSVAGAAGNYVYFAGDQEDPAGGQHRHQPHGGHAERGSVPEHGRADGIDRRGIRLARCMLSKVADFFEAEVDDAVDACPA